MGRRFDPDGAYKKCTSELEVHFSFAKSLGFVFLSNTQKVDYEDQGAA